MKLIAVTCFGDLSTEQPLKSLEDARLITREWLSAGVCGSVVDTSAQKLGVIGETRIPCDYARESGCCWLDDQVDPANLSSSLIGKVMEKGVRH